MGNVLHTMLTVLAEKVYTGTYQYTSYIMTVRFVYNMLLLQAETTLYIHFRTMHNNYRHGVIQGNNVILA
jgi:hypothetical protein